MDTAGDYYNLKTMTARALREAIEKVEAARALEPHACAIYDKIITVLKDRLEIAEYVGD